MIIIKLAFFYYYYYKTMQAASVVLVSFYFRLRAISILMYKMCSCVALLSLND